MIKNSYLKLIKTIDSISSDTHIICTRKLIENFYKLYGREYELVIEIYYEYKLSNLQLKR